MSWKRELERLFKYDAWANREALSSLGGSSPTAACRRLAHIVGAERTWLRRLVGGPPAEVWPEPDLAAIASELDLLARRWRDVIETEDPARTVPYTNTRGDRFENTVGDILLQLLLHGAYHRGQIAADVRAHGGEPAVTDFIHATRERII